MGLKAMGGKGMGMDKQAVSSCLVFLAVQAKKEHFIYTHIKGG